MTNQITAFQILETLKQAREYTSTNNGLTSRGIAEVDNLLIDLQDKLLDRFGSDPQDAPLISLMVSGKPQPEGPFQIQFNEFQRRLIIAGFMVATTTQGFRMRLERVPGFDQEIENALQSFEDLLKMFIELPKNNTEGMLHGFCL